MFCGRSSSGRAPPCQGGGSGFEPRRPLHFIAPVILAGAFSFVSGEPAASTCAEGAFDRRERRSTPARRRAFRSATAAKRRLLARRCPVARSNKKRRVSTRRFLLGSAPVGRSTPRGSYMLGANELPLRQGFACGKTLVRRISAAPLCGAPLSAGGLFIV